MGETGGEPPLTRQLRIPGQQVSIQGRRISPERAPACPVRCGIVVCGMDPLGAGPQDRWAEARAREIGDSSLALAGSVLARTMRERRVRCSVGCGALHAVQCVAWCRVVWCRGM